MAIAGGLLLPALLFGWAGNVQMLVAWWQTVSDAPVGPASVAATVSIGAMWTQWLGLSRVAIFLTILSMTAVLALAATVWMRRHLVFDPDYLEFALVLLLIPLLTSASAGELLVLGTPAVVCLLDRWSDVTPRWRVATGVAVIAMAASAVVEFGPGSLRPIAGTAVTGAALAVLVASVHLRWRGLA
jgi:hypothetical protein